MESEWLESTSDHKDLKLIINEKLKSNKQALYTHNKANRI